MDWLRMLARLLMHLAPLRAACAMSRPRDATHGTPRAVASHAVHDRPHPPMPRAVFRVIGLHRLRIPVLAVPDCAGPHPAIRHDAVAMVIPSHRIDIAEAAWRNPAPGLGTDVVARAPPQSLPQHATERLTSTKQPGWLAHGSLLR